MTSSFLYSKSRRASSWSAASVMGLMFLGMAGMADATVISGESTAFGVSVDLNADGATANVGTTPLSNTAPPIYDNSQSLASFNASSSAISPLPVTVNTGLINDHVQSDVDGGSGARSALGETSVNELGLQLGSDTAPLLTIASNETITASAEIAGDHGALSATQDSVLEDLSMSVLGTPVTFNLDANARAAPNTTLVDVNGVAGLDIILNEQTQTGNGVSNLSGATNAIHVLFDGVDLGTLNVSSLSGDLSGDVVVSHGDAALSAQATPAQSVPVPTPLPLMLLGGLAMAAARWIWEHPWD